MVLILQLGDPSVLKGSKNNLGFPGGLSVQSFSWGGQNQGIGLSGGSLQSHRGAMTTAFAVVHNHEGDVPTLWELAFKGKSIGTAKINFLESPASGATGYQVIMSDTIISNIQDVGTATQFTLDFRDAERRFLMKL